MNAAADARESLVRRGLWLNYTTIGYNALEAVVSIIAGLLAGSVALALTAIDNDGGHVHVGSKPVGSLSTS